MDETDVAILSHLFRDARAAHGEVATAVGLSASAVAARIKKLEDSGVLRGVAASPAPQLLGLREGLLVFQNVDDLDEREADVLASLPDVSGVRFVDVTIDRAVHVTVLFRDDEDWERVERASSLLIGRPPTLAIKTDHAEQPGALRAPDWRILRALVPDGRLSLKDLSTRTGISFKTLKKRLSSLRSSGSLRLEPVLSPAEASGLVLFSMSIQLRGDAKVEDVLAVLPDSVIVQQNALLTIHVARATLREAQDDVRRVKASGAVDRVLFTIATRRRADAWMDEAIVTLQTAHDAPVPVPLPRGK